MAGTDFSHLTSDELIKGIKALDLPDYIRSKAYGIDVRETLAQMTEMTIQLGVNMGLSPDEALKWARKLQETVSQSEFDSWVATLLDGGPSIFMNTLTELQTTYPNGAVGVALVRETDPAKIYVWNGSAWEDFGDYQGIEVKDRTVTSDKIALGAVTPSETSFLETGVNLFDGTYIEAFLGGDASRGTFNPRTGEGRRTAVIKVQPSTTYTISKSESNRFRIAVNDTYPVSGEILKRYPKDADVSSDNPFEDIFTLTTLADEYYLIIDVSNASEEPTLFVEFGEESTVYSDKVVMNKKVEAPNIVKGKNLFDGKYHPWALSGNIDNPETVIMTEDREHARSAFVHLKKNTDYTISKEVSNRFRVALIDKVPVHADTVSYIRDDVYFEDSGTEFTFNSGDYSYVIIVVSNNANYIEEPFLQIEEGIVKTDWKTFGYELFPQATPIGRTKNSESHDVLSIEDFRESAGEPDGVIIQRAFDSAYGKIVSFESGREYNIDSTVVAKAGKVRGINGNNATLVLNGDITGVRYEGTLTGSANPGEANNRELDLKESNAFIERLRVTSKNGHEGRGIEITKLISANIENCHAFNLKNGIVIKGRNRNLIFENCHVRDNLENGLLFENVNLHQLNMTGMHIGYNKNGISIIDGEIANWQMSACDIESNSSSSYGQPESLINIETTENGKTNMWEVNFSALTIQDHGTNTKPLINVDVKKNELLNFVLGSSHVSNSSTTQPLIYIDGGNRIGINNVTMKNISHLNESIVLGDNNDNVIISSNHLSAPIRYGDLTKLIVSTNITTGFVLEDVDDGNVLITNNI